MSTHTHIKWLNEQARLREEALKKLGVIEHYVVDDGMGGTKNESDSISAQSEIHYDGRVVMTGRLIRKNADGVWQYLDIVKPWAYDAFSTTRFVFSWDSSLWALTPGELWDFAKLLNAELAPHDADIEKFAKLIAPAEDTSAEDAASFDAWIEEAKDSL